MFGDNVKTTNLFEEKLKKRKIYENVIWEIDSVYERSLVMLQKAFNPLRLMSTELYLYSDSGTYVEGPLFEMELWLKINDLAKVLESNEKSLGLITRIQPVLTKEYINIVNGFKPVINEKPKPLEIQAPVEESKTQPKKKIKSYDVSPASKELRNLWKLQGYALAFKTIKVHLRHVYIDYLDEVISQYITNEQVIFLKGYLEQLLRELVFFYIKYYNYIVGKGKGITKSKTCFLRKGDVDYNSIGPIVIQPDELKIYVFRDKTWRTYVSKETTAEIIRKQAEEEQAQEEKNIDLFEAALNDDVLGEFIEDVPKQNIIQEEKDFLDAVMDDRDEETIAKQMEDFEHMSLCLKCLKSCE